MILLAFVVGTVSSFTLPNCLVGNCTNVRGSCVSSKFAYKPGSPPDPSSNFTNLLDLPVTPCKYPWGVFAYYTFDRAWCLPPTYQFPTKIPTSFRGYYYRRSSGKIFVGVDVNGNCREMHTRVVSKTRLLFTRTRYT